MLTSANLRLTFGSSSNGSRVTHEREDDLAQGPGHARHADDEAALADVRDLAQDVHRRLEQRQHAECGRHLVMCHLVMRN